ncbi:hypothetical protein [Bradyrhizobium sp. B117]|uniref:Mu transposase domain-containing protein n=1 Tax=Bradyrhizobium sp. B117 TaxID=3140246 RepID=UPI003183849E
MQADCAVEIDGNAYSVPWRLIGETVRATIADGVVRIHHGSMRWPFIRSVSVGAIALLILNTLRV